MDLITLAQAGNYLNLSPTQYTADVVLPALISGASQEFLTQTGMPYVAAQSFAERRNGTGTASMTLRNRPIQTITSLVINNVSVAPSPDGVQAGYVIDELQIALYLVGGFTALSMPFRAIGFQGYPGVFARGFGNVFINGTAGYPNNAASVTAVVPAATPPATVAYYSNPLFATLVPSAGATVTNQNTNLPFTQVTGTPSAGEFALNPDATFVFSAADAGIPILINYWAIGIPLDIQKCAYEMVGWAYKNRDRIGQQSRHFADSLSEVYQTTPFSAMSKLTIQRYTRKDPIFT